jgi:hypothetical protein
MRRCFVLASAVILVSACEQGARDVDYPPSRGISADIDATHSQGASALYPGMTVHGEPLGAFPWRLDERHPNAP